MPFSLDQSASWFLPQAKSWWRWEEVWEAGTEVCGLCASNRHIFTAENMKFRSKTAVTPPPSLREGAWSNSREQNWVLVSKGYGWRCSRQELPLASQNAMLSCRWSQWGKLQMLRMFPVEKQVSSEFKKLNLCPTNTWTWFSEMVEVPAESHNIWPVLGVILTPLPLGQVYKSHSFHYIFHFLSWEINSLVTHKYNPNPLSIPF